MKYKNEVVVGVVVVLGIIIVAVGAYWLTGRAWGGQQREIVASFRQVGLLTEGNPVNYRGVQVGRIEKIQLGPRGDGVFVTMSVQPDLVFPGDPAVLLSAQTFFGDWQAELVSEAQYPEQQFTVTTSRGVLPGAALPDITQLTAVAARIAGDLEILSSRVQIAFTEETAVKIREAVENFAEASQQIGGFVDQQTGTYAQVSRNVLAASDNFRRTTESANQVMNELGQTVSGGEVKQILANAQQASANLEQLSAQLNSPTTGVPTLMARADTTLAAFGQTAQVAGGVLQNLSTQTDQLGPTLVEARQAMATLNRIGTQLEQGDGTLGRLIEDPAIYEEMQRSITTLRRLMADIQANPGKYVGALQVF
ncbi:MAG: MlaD family protein [Longimicrobiaceae bacterium]